jgi:thiol-disulfide isomerase/thioredoxin
VSDPPSARARGRSVLLVSALLAASLLIGFLAQRLTHPPQSTLRALPDAGPPIPVAPARLARHPIPEELPDVVLPRADGTLEHLWQWRGRPLIVNFWATWCEPCRREIPLLKRLRHERAADGLEIVGIAVDLRNDVRRYAAAQGIDYPVLIGEEGGLAAASAFGMDTVLPFSVFADAKGRIVSVKVGELHADEAKLILDRINSVDAGDLALAAAQHEIAEGLNRSRAARVAAEASTGSDSSEPDAGKSTQEVPK